jgi:tetratricopeptide (TPR) repeat protein
MSSGVVDDAMVALLEEALAALGDGDDVLRSRLLARLAIELSFSPHHERRAALAEEALTLARRTGLPDALGPALMARHWSLWRPENLDERLGTATELLRLARTAGSAKTELQGHRWRMMGLLEHGDVDGADLEMEAYAELAHQRGQPAELWHVHLYRAMRHLLAGRYREADAESRTGFAMGREIGETNAHQGFALQQAALLRDRGGLAGAEDAVRAHVERYPSIPGWRCLLAHVLAELGHTDEARAHVEDLCRDGFAHIPRDALWLGAVTHLAEAVASLKDVPRARELYGLLSPFADRHVVVAWATTCAGSAARAVALLAAAAGDRDAAASHFELALDRNGASGAAPWTARTSVEYGRWLLSGGHAERTRGLELVTEGLTSAERLGMAPLVELATSVSHA